MPHPATSMQPDARQAVGAVVRDASLTAGTTRLVALYEVDIEPLRGCRRLLTRRSGEDVALDRGQHQTEG